MHQHPTSPYRRTSWPRRLIRAIVQGFSDVTRLLLYTAFFFALLAAISYWVVVKYIKWEDEIRTPDLSGLTVVDALEILREHRIGIKLDRMQPHERLPEGHIISQIPLPGSRMKTGTPIRVVLSQGFPLVRVPAAVVGETQLAAGIRLRSVGLTEGNVAKISVPGVDGGIVLATDPPPGSGVVEGAPVNFLVSAGETASRIRTMPNLIGLPVDGALELLAERGLTAHEQRAEFDPEAFPGRIHHQAPPPGTPIEEWTTITIVYNPEAQDRFDPEPSTNDETAPLPAIDLDWR